MFILAQEVLSRLLDREFHLKKISGVKANLNGPAITHVKYADDIVLFSKATRMPSMNVLTCTASGQANALIGANLAYIFPGILQGRQQEALNRYSI